MSDHALPLRLIPEQIDAPADGSALVDSYRRLADVFHDVLAEQSLDALLDRIADALSDLIPHDSLTIYEADEPRRLLVPVWARDKWADKILADRCPFGVGLTGWGVEHREPVRVNQAHLDPRVMTVPGTPADEPGRELLGMIRRARDDHDCELLAAEAVDHVRCAHRVLQRLREAAQNLVPGAVSKDVVDALEVVDVEHEHRDRVV